MTQNATTGPLLTHPALPTCPDAPTMVSVPSFESPSPYHPAAETREQQCMVLSQIRVMAIAFVHGYSRSIDGKLDFSVASLQEVDKIIEASIQQGLRGKDNVEVFIAMAGAYVGQVLEGATVVQGRKAGRWHAASPRLYFFSGFRIEKNASVFETNPFAAVTKRLAYLLDKERVPEEAPISKYAEFVLRA